MGKSGKGIGIFALLIAIGALGLGVYQFILPSPSEGPKIYSASNYDITYLDFDTFEIIPNLNVTYNTKAGDSVLLEFSCLIYMDSSYGTTTIDITFDIDGVPPSPWTQMSVTCLSSDVFLRSSFIFRHNIQSSPAGSHVVRILTYIDQGYTSSFVRYCVLTATVY